MFLPCQNEDCQSAADSSLTSFDFDSIGLSGPMDLADLPAFKEALGEHVKGMR